MAGTRAGGDTALQDTITAVCADFGNRADALIEILHGIQENLGYVPDEAVPVIGQLLNLSRADVHGVVTFYHDFNREKPGRHVIKMCRAESCQANGSNDLAAHAEKTLGIPFGDTTKDGAFTLKAVYCLGNCGLGPSVLIGESLHARVDAEKLDALVSELKGAGK